MKQTTLITGASAGIGLELARVFAQNKSDLVLVARSLDKLEALKAELVKTHGISCQVIELDLSTPEAPLRLFEECQKRKIQVDVLINNAGFGLFGKFQDTSLERELEMIRLNVMTLTELSKRFLKGMVERKSGKILNVASTAAFQPGPMMAVYFATKAFVLSFTEALSEELQGSGVSAMALCPGPTTSNFQSEAKMDGLNMAKFSSATSEEVAKFAYESLQKNKVVAIEGFRNWLVAETVRFSPRFLVRKVIHKIQQSSAAT